MTDKAVIFDMDGVLVDSYLAHFKAWQRLADRLGQAITEGEFAETFGRKNEDIIHDLFASTVPDDEADALGDWKEEQYREILREDFPAMDGAVELIDELNAAGWGLAVGSSGPPKNVQVALEGLERADAFDATVNGSDVSVGKPDPEVFLTAAEKLGAEPGECAVIEDATAGVRAARAAGMAAIAVAGTSDRPSLLSAGAHLVIESLRELSPERIADLVGRLAGARAPGL